MNETSATLWALASLADKYDSPGLAADLRAHADAMEKLEQRVETLEAALEMAQQSRDGYMAQLAKTDQWQRQWIKNMDAWINAAQEDGDE